MKIKIIIATAFFVYFLVLTPKKIYSQNWSLTGNAPTPANFVGSFSNADLKFRTFNTQRMVILGGLPGGATTGFVGVNTATPQNRLHLNDAATVYSQHTTAASGQTNTDGFWLGVSNLNAELKQKEDAPMNFFTFDVQRMTILGGVAGGATTGFVGIGTTTPTHQLSVLNNINIVNSVQNQGYLIDGILVLQKPGTQNIFLGENAGVSNVSGTENTFLG